MMSDVLLGVNIDHVATLRNARGILYPDPVYSAYVAEQSGADSITVHLREDRRHITDRDVRLLRETIRTTMNLEISMAEEMVTIACLLKPDICCLVPEQRQELTTEGGLNVISNFKKLKSIVSKLTSVDITVSLFIEPDEQQIIASHDVGASCIELHTGAYANSSDKSSIRLLEYKRIEQAVLCASAYGLRVNAGHGLDYHNVRSIAVIPSIQELNIGHAIISRAIFCGLSKAVQDMKRLLRISRSSS